MLIFFYVLSSLLVAWLGRNYRFGFWGYFFSSLFFTPVVGVVIVISSIPFQQKNRGE